MNRTAIYIFLLFICSSLSINAQNLSKGDLIIAGVNQLNRGNNCSTNNSLTHYDNILFITLKDIENGEIITLTDNRYLGNKQFNTTEGFYQLERIDSTIEKGSFFKIDFPSDSIKINQVFNGWKLINRMNRISLNSAGDQVFVLDNGSWNNQGYYLGKILFGYNSFNAWKSTLDTSNSILPESNQDEYDLTYYHFTPNNAVTSLYRIYNGPLNKVSRNEWLIRLMNPVNWDSYQSNSTSNDCSLFDQKVNQLLNSRIEFEEVKDLESCHNQIIKLESINDNNIINYEWRKSYDINFSSYQVVGNTYQLNYQNTDNNDFYITCQLSYQLNWVEDNNNIRTSTKTVNSKIYHIKNLSQPIISPIHIN